MSGSVRSTLPPRLWAIALSIPPGSRVADIGTDHGALPLWLAQSGRAAFCVASEKSEPLLERVRRPPPGVSWAGALAYRVGDGLEAIGDSDRIDTVVLAGLGGKTMVRLLSAPQSANLRLHRLVLQPRTDEASVRMWLSVAGWCPVTERLDTEGGRRHLTLAAEHGDDAALYSHPSLSRSDLFAAGPLLVRSPSDELARAWEEQRGRLAAIVSRGGRGAAVARARAGFARAERILAAISKRGG